MQWCRAQCNVVFELIHCIKVVFGPAYPAQIRIKAALYNERLIYISSTEDCCKTD